MKSEVKLYHLFIRPGYHLHRDHWEQTPLANWREDYMALPALRPVIDRQLRKFLAWRWPKEGANLTQKHRDWLLWLPDMPQLMTALGLAHLSCPDYLLLGEYRKTLEPLLSAQALNQLLGLWQGDVQKPELSPQALPTQAMHTGMRLFAHENQSDWVWKMIWHTLPLEQEGFTTGMSPETVYKQSVYKQMHRLKRFI